MPQRMTRKENWGYLERVLKSAEVAYKGQTAAIELSSGKIVVQAAATGLFPIGYFEEDMTGDGTKKVRVRLFREITLHRFNNAVSNPVADSDVGNNCYFSASDTVSINGTGRSLAGRVYAVTTGGVLISPTATPA